MVQSPSLSRLTRTFALESVIDRLDPCFNEALTIVAKEPGSAKPGSSLDCGFRFSVIKSAHLVIGLNNRVTQKAAAKEIARVSRVFISGSALLIASSRRI